MTTHFELRLPLVAILAVFTGTISGQTLLQPIWTVQEPVINGDSLHCAVDHDLLSGLLYWAFRDTTAQDTWDEVVGYQVMSFDTDGTPISGTPLAFFPCSRGKTRAIADLGRFQAHAEELFTVIQRDRFGGNGDIYPWGTAHDLRIAHTNGDPGYLFGTDSVRIDDADRDSLGIVAAIEQSLLTIGPNGLPTDTLQLGFRPWSVVLAGDTVYCGAPPAIHILSRDPMQVLSSHPVPVLGGLFGSRLIKKGDTLCYASLNAGSTLNLGMMDTQGNLLWSLGAPIPGPARLTDLVMDATGNAWVSLIGGSQPQQGWLLGVNANGTLLDEYFHGTSIEDLATDGSRLFLTGVTTSGNEVYLAGFDPGLISGTQEERSSAFRLFPNPASDRLYVQAPNGDGRSRFWLSDPRGRIVRGSEQAPAGPFEIDVSAIAPGTYVLYLLHDDQHEAQPFVIIR